MAKPKPTGKDYGHKTYMSTTSYPEAIGRPTDKNYDNRIKRPHSDDKKPYMPEEYQEMEHYWTPYDPPNLVPPGMSDDPRIPPNLPDNPSTGKDPDQDKEADFTGCLFSWNAGPSQLKVGETTWHSIDVGPNDPLVRLYVNYGPVKILGTTAKSVMQCVAGMYPTCLVSAEAIDFDPAEETEHGSLDGSYMAQIVGVTAAGFTCTWDLTVVYCPPTVELEYDFDNSAETILRNESATVYVIGGNPPFNWAVEGEGYTLRNAKTGGRANTLDADGDSCGAAIITITDACDEVVTGAVRNTTGYWDEKESQCGLVVAASWDYTCYFPGESQWRVVSTVIQSYQKQFHQEVMAISSAGQSGTSTEGECETDRAAYDCGSWDNPCLPYPGTWTLTKPPGTCDGSSPRWSANYEECSSGGRWALRPCYKAGSYWYFLRAQHTNAFLRYWEWECE